MVDLRKGFCLQRSAKLSDIRNPRVFPILEKNITHPFGYAP